MTSTRLDTFRQVIEQAGLVPPATIIADGKLHRFASNGDRADDAGWYTYFSDETPAGVFGCWRKSFKQTWSSKADSMLTPAERERQRAHFDEARRQREQDERLRHSEAAKRAQTIWGQAATAPDDHPYLQKKQVHPHGLRVDAENRLLIPVMLDGTLSSLQFIDANGGKQFLHGGAVKSGSFTLGALSDTDTLLICEGFATGASLYEAAGLPVIVAFNAGNLVPVARALRETYASRTLIVCADDDAATEGNPGLAKATEAAGAAAGRLIVPDFGTDRPEGVTDFNDLANLRGLDAVRVCVENTMNHATVTPEVPTTESRAIFRRVADIQARPIRWLWPGRIARGKVSMLAGNPGLGKSQVTISLAAIVSMGGLWPVDGGDCEAGNTIILSAEDDPADTIRPRLEAAGADLSRVYILDAVLDDSVAGGGASRAFNLRTDLSRLATMLEEIGGASLIVIDPITAYLGITDSHKNAEIRALLSPLAELAGKQEAAVVCVSHFNKDVHTEALMRVTGSLAFVAAARAAYVVAKDPENEARRLFLPLKNNLGNDQTGLAFTVESTQVESSAGTIETSRVVWAAGTVTVTATEAMRPQIHDDERSELGEAKDFLRGLLADGAMPSRQIQADAAGAGHAWRTVQRAQKSLGIVAVKKGMKEGWVWQLGTSSHPEECQEPLKVATPGGWKPSHSSGGLGGLRGDDTVPVEVEI